MSYIGNTPTNQNFVAGSDQFNGTGSQTVFTLSRNVNTVNDIQVVVSNVPQDPFTAYSVAGNSLTFTSAPPAGTGNVYVTYRATNVQYFVPSPLSVGPSQLSASGTASSGTFLRGDNAWAGTITSGTAVASTSGTSIDFTGIPDTAKRVTVMCSGISKSGTANFLFQLGDSGGVETTGYTGGTFAASSGAIIYAAPTNGFQTLGDAAGVVLMYGSIVFTNITDNTWVASGLLFGNSFNVQIAGEKTLSATLDRVRITTTNGTDTFDAGTINIMWE